MIIKSRLITEKAEACFKAIIVIYFLLFLLTSLPKVFTLFTFMPQFDVHLLSLILRETCFLLIILFFIKDLSKRNLLIFMSVSFLLTLNVFFIGRPIEYIIFGLRAMLPLLLIFMVSGSSSTSIIKENSYKKIEFFVQAILILHLGFQILHFLFGKGYYSFIFENLNARNPGLFYYPAAAASLTATLLLLKVGLSSEVKQKMVWPYFLSFFLASSITGLLFSITIGAYLFKKISSKFEQLLIASLIILSFPFLHYARFSMSGDQYLEQTGGTRLDILIASIKNATLFPENFGIYTNASRLQEHHLVSDSMFASSIGNLGIIWSFVFIGLIGYHIRSNFKKSTDYYFILLVSLLISCSSMVITEIPIVFALFLLSASLKFTG